MNLQKTIDKAIRENGVHLVLDAIINHFKEANKTYGRREAWDFIIETLTNSNVAFLNMFLDGNFDTDGDEDEKDLVQEYTNLLNKYDPR